MAVIIGSLTQVVITSQNAAYDSGIQSINWNLNRQPNRLWQLGSWDPWKTQVGAIITVSMTTYASSLPQVPLILPTACVDSVATMDVSIVPGACNALVDSVIESGMYITSYSYSKGDAAGFATESWSLQKWIASGVTGDTFISIPIPTYVLMGISDGSRSGDVTNKGILFAGEAGATNPLVGHIVEGDQGSVSAGFPGIGNADTTEQGIVDKVGGGTLEAGGKIGQGSASIPHQPIYV